MKLQDFNPILYLEDYENIPDEIYRWKQDEELRPGPGWGSGEAGFYENAKDEPQTFWYPKNENNNSGEAYRPDKLCVGIGRYHTESDGEIYLCTLLDRNIKTVLSCSFGVYRSPELVGKALDIFFRIYPFPAADGPPEYNQRKISLLSSRNPIYLKREYLDIISHYPVEPEMTTRGTRGGASVVSTYFSQLMRRKGSTVFVTWQDAVDWLSTDIERFNMKMQ